VFKKPQGLLIYQKDREARGRSNKDKHARKLLKKSAKLILHFCVVLLICKYYK